MAPDQRTEAERRSDALFTYVMLFAVLAVIAFDLAMRWPG